MVNLTSALLDCTLRVTVLQAAGPVFDARVDRIDGTRILVASDRPVDVGAAVQLDASDRLLLGEALSWERLEDGFRVLLEIQHSLLHADLEQIRLGQESGPRASAARG